MAELAVAAVPPVPGVTTEGVCGAGAVPGCREELRIAVESRGGGGGMRPPLVLSRGVGRVDGAVAEPGVAGQKILGACVALTARCSSGSQLAYEAGIGKSMPLTSHSPSTLSDTHGAH